MKGIATLLVGLVVMGGAVAAQQPQPAPAAPPAVPRAPAPPAAPRTPAPTQAAPPVQVAPPPYVDSSAGGQIVNIRLDVSISDQAGAAPLQPKMLTLLLADRNSSQVRTNFEDRYISMDARPTIVDGKIKLNLTISSDNPRAIVAATAGPPQAAQYGGNTLVWNQSLTAIVESGKPLVVFENSDPSHNRKLSVEVKATILK